MDVSATVVPRLRHCPIGEPPTTGLRSRHDRGAKVLFDQFCNVLSWATEYLSESWIDESELGVSTGDIQAQYRLRCAFRDSTSRSKPHADPVEDLRNGWDMNIEFGVANPGLFSIMSSDPHLRSQSPAVAAGTEILRKTHQQNRPRR